MTTDARSPLTPRQREIAALLLDGLPRREIAARLCIEDRTVRNHITAIGRALGVAPAIVGRHTQAQIVARLRRTQED